jgi:glycosyltransferase involved in cell wall biosynthesis
MDDVSPMRTGRLASNLSRRGHEVTWWGSNFYHQRKVFISDGALVTDVDDGFTLRLLVGQPYERNFSWARYRHSKRLAKSLRVEMGKADKPDVILASLPSHDLALEATRYAATVGAKVAIDIRDIWPTSFVDKLPKAARPFGRVALRGDVLIARRALRAADSLIGISSEYLDWGLDMAGRSRSDADRILPLGSPRLEPSSGLSDKRPQWLSELDGKTVFGFLGTFGGSYDIESVIECARRLEATRPHVHFLLGGDGERADLLKAHAAGLCNVVFTGWLGQAGVGALLSRLDVGLSPYVLGAPQSLPNKPFQYMSAGVPQISSLDGEFSDLLNAERIGVGYDAQEVSGLVEAVEWLDDRPEQRKAMGRRAQALFNDRFDAGRICESLSRHLESMVLHEHGASSR